MSKWLARLRQESPPAPVTKHGRTFRKCGICGRMGWYPQADAEVCCGQAMRVVDDPAMTVVDYVRFIGFPKAYASGKISHAEVVAMMESDHIHPLPEKENACSGESVR